MFQLAKLITFVALAGSAWATVAQVKADIATITSQTTALDNAVIAFPATGGTLVQALAIHSASQTLITSIKTATADTIATGPVSSTDGQAILSSVQALEPLIEKGLNDLVAKKAAFQALPVGGIPALVLQDVQQLSGNTTLFENALIANAPPELTASATAVKDKVNAAFASAIAALK